MKYIIVREQQGLETPVFCLAPRTHAELATAWRRDDSRCIVSAGFVEFLPEGVRTFGRSTSLNLGPRPHDARLIAAFYKATLAAGLSSEARVAGADTHTVTFPRVDAAHPIQA